MTAFRAAQRGNTLAGFIVGLVAGLAIAVAVALYVTKAPIPFINKLGHPPDAPLPEQGKLPDPNRSLYTRDAAAAIDAASTSGAVPNPVVVNPAPLAPPAAAPAPAPVANARAPTATQANAGRPAPDAAEASKQTFLQAGAYHSLDDAETMKGKLALLGFEATVTNVDREGTVVYRVRLGPYGRIEDLNRVRQRLAENGVDAAVVPAGKAAL